MWESTQLTCFYFVVCGFIGFPADTLKIMQTLLLMHASNKHRSSDTRESEPNRAKTILTRITQLMHMIIHEAHDSLNIKEKVFYMGIYFPHHRQYIIIWAQVNNITKWKKIPSV